MRIRTRTRSLAALLPLLLAVAPACGDREGSSKPPRPTPGQRFITDDGGRALILNGVNVESYAKGAPDRMPSITREEVRMLSERWGFNVVRFLIFWDAIEPAPGRYDEAYLARVEERLDWFHEAGLAVFLDMHQDVYAARFCCDGAPEWAIRDDGLPHELQPIWSFNYFEPAPTRAFDHFWRYRDGDHPDLQDHYVAAWRVVAERFRAHPAVIGYDLMNEPYPGSLFDAAEAATRRSPDGGASSEHFDRYWLAPFYQRAIDAIREVDQRSWIFFESRYGAPGNGSPSFLPRLTDRRAGDARLVYAPHLYSTLVEGFQAYLPGNETLARWEEHRRQEAERLDAPVLIGEWGFGWEAVGAERFMAETFEMIERMMVGFTYWSFDPGGPTSWAFYDRAHDADNPNVAYLARAYPRAVAGTPLAFSWDRDARVFELRFAATRGVDGPTEIYVPARRFFPDGFDVDVEGAGSTWTSEWDATREVLSVRTSRGGERLIRVRPRGAAPGR